MTEKPIWGGRFRDAPEDLVQDYTESLDIDQHFFQEDILCSQAHVAMLSKQGVLSAEESSVLHDGLNQVRKEIEAGQFSWRRDLEDVHMNIEKRLGELVGQVAEKLHTGRSRNDQVALDFRLFVSKRVTIWQEKLCALMAVLTDQAENHAATILPGYTHLQPAQPVSLGHHLLAYVQMFKRDAERIQDSQKRIRVSPLGAAALAGTTYELDPDYVAMQVGFSERFQNSMDAVSDRDFIAEGLFAAGLIMTHLSRLCEEIILWANPGFGFVRLPDGYATGSSIMPQKKNPDVAELMRGKTGRVYGHLMALFTVLKGLPLSYNRDLQEDKPGFIDADKTVSMSLEVMAGMIESLEFRQERMAQATRDGFLNATELADYLVSKGLPFRQAHHLTGQLVAYAETKNAGLENLDLKEFQHYSPLIEDDVYTCLDNVQAVNRRKTMGGTGFESVRVQIDRARTWLKGMKSELGGSV